MHSEDKQDLSLASEQSTAYYKYCKPITTSNLAQWLADSAG